MIVFEEEKTKKNECNPIAKIKVIGVGGAGNNIVNSMIEANSLDVEYIIANTDAQALQHAKTDNIVQLGVKLTRGLGSGANPDIGKRAAEEDLDKVMAYAEGADIVFLTGGMGGGTGSGAISILARALREQGILTIAIVTKPFMFEGRRREKIAEAAIEELRTHVDTLLVLPNQKLIEVAKQEISMLDAFAMINEVLHQSVKGISEIITKPGHINVDFADLRAIMKDMGMAVMGTGRASGVDRAQLATLEAISSPLLENMSIKGARGVLLNIVGGPNLGLHEINEAASVIYEQADEDANIILGSVINEELTDEVIVTIVATGFEHAQAKEQQAMNAVPSAEAVQAAVASKAAVLDRQEAPMAQEAAPAEEVIQVAPAKEPSRALVNQDDLDVPTFMRRNNHQKNK